MAWAVIQFHEYVTEMDEYEDYETAKKAYDELFVLGTTKAYLVEIKEQKGRS